MPRLADKEHCTGCGACTAVCLRQAIKMVGDELGFLYPQVDVSVCLECKQCTEHCPVIYRAVPENCETASYACRTMDEKIRATSTSGGIFSEIAEYVLSRGGAVYGAGFDKNFNVVHICAENSEEYLPMRGSKYPQSDLKGIFKDVQNQLDKRRIVLFTGTPCQTAGLEAYIGQNANLLLMDFICMCVGSPEVWSRYLDNFQNRYKLSEIVFKDKKTGWHKFHVKIRSGSKVVYESPDRNLYMNGYLKRLYVRPSCLICPFKGTQRTSDFTVADCWGIDRVFPDMDDDRGISALLIHTQKGKQIFAGISERLLFRSYPLESISEYNKHLCLMAPSNPDAEFFKETFINRGIKIAMKKYCKQKQTVGQLVKSIFNNLCR